MRAILVCVVHSVRCLARFGIYPSRTLGVDGRMRFHSDNPVRLLDGDPVHAKAYYFTSEDVAIGNLTVSRLLSLNILIG